MKIIAVMVLFLLVLALLGIASGEGERAKVDDRTSNSGNSTESLGTSGDKPVVGHEWQLLFAEDFNSLNLNRWRLFEGNTTTPGNVGCYYAPDHVFTRDGLLIISGYRDVKYWNMFATGGVDLATPIENAKYLVRMRADKGHGIAFCLLLTNVSIFPEINFAEDNGGERDFIDATYWDTTGNRSQVNVKLNTTQWHIYGIEVSPGKVVYSVDGQDYWTVTKNLPQGPLTLGMQTQAWDVGSTLSWFQLINSTTPKTTDMQIDWVMAYAPTGQP